MIKVLALSPAPVEAAATRFRVQQFVEPLHGLGVEVSIKPFLSKEQFRSLYRGGSLASKASAILGSITSRFGDVLKAGEYDLLFVQREAMLLGPGIVEWVLTHLRGLPMVLDLDDATYLRYISPTYGRLGSGLKFFGKTDKLIKRAVVVTCGNRFIAEYVKRKGTKAVVIPTVVDLNQFKPQQSRNNPDGDLTIGWVGTHSTFPFLQSIFPVLEKLSIRHRFKLRIVGAGREEIRIRGVDVQNLHWSMEREPHDFASLDIGLYPITTSASADEEWIKGKSGFKAVQYMAVGVPFVMSPVGICAEMGQPGVTHFNAASHDDWYNALNALLSDNDLRTRMGSAGRAHAEMNYRVDDQADILAGTFHEVIEEQRLDER
jgi:glycosyltransferase involved in cell wall biosynthesis